jgi:hypothetical protein
MRARHFRKVAHREGRGRRRGGGTSENEEGDAEAD